MIASLKPTKLTGPAVASTMMLFITTNTAAAYHGGRSYCPSRNLPAGTIVRDHRNGKNCQYTVGDWRSCQAYLACERE
jgi:hypothetical protein